MSLGPIFLVLVVGVFLLIVLIILHFARKFKPIKIITQKVYSMIKYKIFWNATLTYIMESYMLLTLKSLTSISNGLGWSNWASVFQSLFSIFTLTICIVAPAIMTIYFKINFKKFRLKKFK